MKRKLKEYDPKLRGPQPGIADSMIPYFGTEVTITKRDPIDGWLRIKEDLGSYWWYPEWFKDEWGFGI